MGYFLWDLAGDLAVARGGGPVKTDPMDLVENESLRRRIAALMWIPGGAVALAVGSGTGVWVLSIPAFVVLFAGLWLFAEGTGGIKARFRSPRAGTRGLPRDF